MLPIRATSSTRATIVGLYKKATYCYATPFALLLLGLVLPALGLLWLLVLLPFGLVGLLLTSQGMALASRTGDQEKKDVGYANLILGFIILVLGLLGLGFCYTIMK